MQELCQALLDLLGFGLGSGEPEEVIVEPRPRCSRRWVRHEALLSDNRATPS